MFSTVRYFIKTSLIFLFIGLLTGIYMSVSRYVLLVGNHPSMISAHTHIVLVGSVMMMIMGVALWFFPKAAKEDKRYKPSLILFTYWLITSATALRFISQVTDSFYPAEWVSYLITIFSVFQVTAFGLFFYSMWGRIRSVGSHLREAKGEKF
ncbi:MAG: cbb3-type cytochrome c oxidase subunit I [Ignavibacteriaceae bacterium]